jgi:hypothetical protein
LDAPVGKKFQSHPEACAEFTRSQKWIMTPADTRGPFSIRSAWR